MKKRCLYRQSSEPFPGFNNSIDRIKYGINERISLKKVWGEGCLAQSFTKDKRKVGMPKGYGQVLGDRNQNSPEQPRRDSLLVQ